MIKLDDDFLQSLNLGALPAQDKGAMLKHIYDTLEMRVGMRLAEQMSDEQLAEFESYIDRKDNEGALAWLETNLPNYKDVVAEELEKLKVEVGAAAPQILADAQARHMAAAEQLAQAQQNLPPAPAAAPAVSQGADQSHDGVSSAPHQPDQTSQAQHNDQNDSSNQAPTESFAQHGDTEAHNLASQTQDQTQSPNGSNQPAQNSPGQSLQG